MPDKAPGPNEPRPTRPSRKEHRRAPEPEAVFKIEYVDGEEGDNIAQRQAEVLHKILRWQAVQKPTDTS
ncbi:hypothetical protein [Nocardia sp. NPDC052566]|uniref:hypothetical protein n=1 Tax=Nocardia sp. NPDC052566 TaxID=3364330 RepID=UPI0037C8A48F